MLLEGTFVPSFFCDILNNMYKIIALRYIDAFYSTEKELSSNILIPHYAIGKPVSVFHEHITISFIEKSHRPWKGLLLPWEALILGKQQETTESACIQHKIKNIKIGTAVSVLWKDLVYFENGVLPMFPTLMCTKGTLYSVTPEVVILKNPETTKVVPKSIQRYQKGSAGTSFLVIPKCFITDIKIYGA